MNELDRRVINTKFPKDKEIFFINKERNKIVMKNQYRCAKCTVGTYKNCFYMIDGCFFLFSVPSNGPWHASLAVLSHISTAGFAFVRNMSEYPVSSDIPFSQIFWAIYILSVTYVYYTIAKITQNYINVENRISRTLRVVTYVDGPLMRSV